MASTVGSPHHAELHLEELKVAARAAGGATDRADYAQRAVEQLGRLLGSERCSLLILRDGRIYQGGSVGLPASFMEALEGAAVGPHVGTCGAAASRGQTVITEDIRTDPKWDRFRDLAEEAGLRSCWSVPLRLHEGDVLGTFATYDVHPSRPEPEAVELTEAHASLVALGLDRLHREQRLSESYESVVIALSSALDVRDEYTGAHSTETASLAVEAGRLMGIEGDELRRVEQAALLHDIGKLGISTEILHAPRALTDEERKIMEQHPVIGERILAGIPYLDEVARAVRHEHERWDGLGYPDGIAGEAIPVASRLVFVCDAWHAMTSDRPYRKALPTAAALEELRSNSGTQFDPRAVEALLSLVSNVGRPQASPEALHPAAADAAEESRSRALDEVAASVGAQDIFVFRLVSPGHYSHLGGIGRGEGWAGNVELSAAAERDFARAVAEGTPVCLDFPERGRVVGPYYARSAAIVPCGTDSVVVMGSSTGSLAGACAQDVAVPAARAATAIEGVPPAKRLADELEVLEAVRAITAVAAVTLEDTLARIAEVTAGSLSCEFGAVVVRDHAGEVRMGTADRGWTPPSGLVLMDELAPLLELDARLPVLAQDAAGSSGLARKFAAGGATSLHAFRVGKERTAAMVLVHATPRGFTVLCRRLARSAGDAAEIVIGRALAQERIAESHRDR